MGNSTDNILNLVANFVDEDSLMEDSDIHGELGVYGDDWDEMISRFAKEYSVDMSAYLWYFHTRPEGIDSDLTHSGNPHNCVKRIPITPKDLFRIAEKQKWDVEYPPHSIPKPKFETLYIVSIVLWSVMVLWVVYCLLF